MLCSLMSFEELNNKNHYKPSQFIRLIETVNKWKWKFLNGDTLSFSISLLYIPSLYPFSLLTNTEGPFCCPHISKHSTYYANFTFSTRGDHNQTVFVEMWQILWNNTRQSSQITLYRGTRQTFCSCFVSNLRAYGVCPCHVKQTNSLDIDFSHTWNYLQQFSSV